MAKDRDEQFNEDELSLDAILAEFGSGSSQRQGETPAAGSDVPDPYTQDAPVEESERVSIPIPAQKKAGKITHFPGVKEPPEAPAAPPREKTDKVLEFPGQEPENPVAEGIGKLRRRADEFAEHMFEEEGKATAKAVRRAEKLIPGVDEEETPPPVRERKPRRVRPPAPDIPPAELAKRYAKGIKGAKVRMSLVFLLLIPTLYLTLAPTLGSYLPEPLKSDRAMLCYGLTALQGLALLLSLDGVGKALAAPFRSRTGMDLLIVLANAAVLVDGVTLGLGVQSGPERLPFCAPAAVGLWSMLRGNLQERRGQRLACRTAASASEPYLVTRDEGKWNGRDTYAKWSGAVNGFGSQIQGDNGAQRIYHLMVPVILLACICFSLISSLGRRRSEDLLWCLSATLCAAGSLSATLCYGLPWRKMALRLSKSGAALAGWQGVTNTTGSANLLLTDIDLFPVGSVSLNGVKIFGDFPIEKVVGITATVIRDSGSGLEKVFHDLLRSQGAVYRRGEKLAVYEGGGVSEVIRDEQILVGSAAFMVLMDVPLPPGLKVKNAVFCAIDGDLAGIFALNYHLPGTVAPAVDSLIRNKITPVLATRDFNLIPAILRQRFKLPADKMEFPPVERRRDLSDPEQEHSGVITAVLCREGVGPYAEAVVGGRRLRTAVRMATVLSCLGSVVGALLAFYLTFVAAYDSLTAVNLLVFLLMWMVPTPLIAGWVDKY